MPARSEHAIKTARTFDWKVGVNLRYWREHREISQAELAEVANMSDSQICRVEAGERSLTLQQAIAICRTLDIRLDALSAQIAD